MFYDITLHYYTLMFFCIRSLHCITLLLRSGPETWFQIRTEPKMPTTRNSGSVYQFGNNHSTTTRLHVYTTRQRNSVSIRLDTS